MQRVSVLEVEVTILKHQWGTNQIVLVCCFRGEGLTYFTATHSSTGDLLQVKGAGESVRIPSRLLLGIVPEVLLRSFNFWQYQVNVSPFVVCEHFFEGSHACAVLEEIIALVFVPCPGQWLRTMPSWGAV